MALADVQRALGALFTSPETRERFRTAPAETLRDYGLTPAEIAALEHCASGDLQRVHQSLIAKRLLEVAALLPGTRAAMGDEFARAFRKHARVYLPSGIHKHADDARTFAAGLKHLPVARYERAALSAARGARVLIVLCLGARPSTGKRFSIAIWWRPSRRSPLRHWVMF